MYKPRAKLQFLLITKNFNKYLISKLNIIEHEIILSIKLKI